MRLPQASILAGVFGLSGWAGYALTAPPAQPAAPGAPGAVLPAGGPAPRPPAAAPAPPPPPDPGEVLGDPDGTPAPAKPAAAKEGPIRLTFPDLTQWDLDPENVQVPASILALGGKDVDIVGYMIPYGNPDAVEEFLLVQDLGSCCFGQAPLPHHVIECRFTEGKTMAYVPGPVRVRGRFRVEEHRQGKLLFSVFAMTATDCVEVR